MTTALLFSRNSRFRLGMSLGFDSNGRAACNDLGITNGLNFLGLLPIACQKKKNVQVITNDPKKFHNHQLWAEEETIVKKLHASHHKLPCRVNPCLQE